MLLPNPENKPSIARINREFVENERQQDAYSNFFADNPNDLLQETLNGRGSVTISIFEGSVHICYAVHVDSRLEEYALSDQMQNIGAWLSSKRFCNNHGESIDPSDAFHNGYDRYTKQWRIEHCNTIIEVTIFAPNN
jgi:hypothetical protein